MSYILVQAFIKSPLQLLRLPGLVIFWLKYRLATTPRQKAAVWQDTHLKYGTNVSPPISSKMLLLFLPNKCKPISLGGPDCCQETARPALLPANSVAPQWQRCHCRLSEGI